MKAANILMVRGDVLDELGTINRFGMRNVRIWSAFIASLFGPGQSWDMMAKKSSGVMPKI